MITKLVFFSSDLITTFFSFAFDRVHKVPCMAQKHTLLCCQIRFSRTYKGPAAPKFPTSSKAESAQSDRVCSQQSLRNLAAPTHSSYHWLYGNP
jgi:hypothetical protein